MNKSPITAGPRRTLWQFLYDFWAKPIAAEPLALFRIVSGAVLLLSLLTSLGPRLPLDLGPDGLSPGQAMDGWQKASCRYCLLRGPTNLPPLDGLLAPEAVEQWRDWCDDPVHASWLFAVLVAAVACLTLGLCTRAATVVAWALFISFNVRLTWVLNGGDSMMRCALFYLMFAPSGAVWSLDRCVRLRLWGAGAEAGPVLIPPWPVRLMQIQLAFVYFFTGLSKIGGDWIDGEAVYWVLNDAAVARWPYHWLPVPMFACRVLSWSTLVFELGFPLGVALARRRRFVLEVRGTNPDDGFRCALTVPGLQKWFLLGGLALHLGILIHTEVGWFSPATVCWYALFLSGEGVRNFVALRWVRRKRSASVDLPEQPSETEEPRPAHPVGV